MIYVIGNKGSSVVKIGFTAGRPSDRLVAIQIGNPAVLEVLWDGEGDRVLEGKLHAAFRPYAIRGEWFDFRGLDPVGEVRAAITAIDRGETPHVLPPSSSTEGVADGELASCVCGHKPSRHGIQGCIVAGYEEWQDCQCSVYASSALLKDVPPVTRSPIPRPETRGWVGPTPPEVSANRQHRWYECVRKEIEGMRWPGGAPMVPGWWPEYLADLITWRIIGCADSSRYQGLVLDEIVRLEWAHAGPMVPGIHAEDLTDRITTRLA
jgi:hypothetical protein